MHKTILLLLLLTLLPTAAFSTTNYDPVVNGNIGGFQGTGWTAYTPTITGLGTTTGLAFFWRRVGDNLEVRGKLTAGTASGMVSVTLPTGLTLDTTKLEFAAATGNNCPWVGFYQQDGANLFGNLAACTTTSTSVIYAAQGVTNSTPMNAQSAGSLMNSSLLTSFRFSVPISGWSAGGASSPALITGATADRIERAKIAAPSGGNCAITSQSGTWISGTPTSSGTGLCTITIAAGYFSAAPTCTCTTDGGVGRACAFNGVPTSTSMTTYTGNTSSPENNTIHVICIGPR